MFCQQNILLSVQGAVSAEGIQCKKAPSEELS
jgi:hypothetical protein